MGAQRLPGDLDKNIDEILAEVDKDKNGEVDYDEVAHCAPICHCLSHPCDSHSTARAASGNQLLCSSDKLWQHAWSAHDLCSFSCITDDSCPMPLHSLSPASLLTSFPMTSLLLPELRLGTSSLG